SSCFGASASPSLGEDAAMYEREHHVRVATILQSLDGDLLERHGCLFGGGTAIVLAHQEYRESLDVDLLVSELSGYREIRQRVREEGIGALCRKGALLKAAKRTEPWSSATSTAPSNGSRNAPDASTPV